MATKGHWSSTAWNAAWAPGNLLFCLLSGYFFAFNVTIPKMVLVNLK